MAVNIFLDFLLSKKAYRKKVEQQKSELKKKQRLSFVPTLANCLTEKENVETTPKKIYLDLLKTESIKLENTESKTSMLSPANREPVSAGKSDEFSELTFKKSKTPYFSGKHTNVRSRLGSVFVNEVNNMDQLHKFWC